MGADGPTLGFQSTLPESGSWNDLGDASDGMEEENERHYESPSPPPLLTEPSHDAKPNLRFVQEEYVPLSTWQSLKLFVMELRWKSFVLSLTLFILGYPVLVNVEPHTMKFSSGDFSLTQNSPDRSTVDYTFTWLPLLFLGIFSYWIEKKCDNQTIREANLACAQTLFAAFEACVYCKLVTDTSKVVIGSLRPDFRNRCFPPDLECSAIPEAFNVLISTQCCGDEADIKEGRRSFFSGHTSNTACSALYLTMYAIWTVYCRNHNISKTAKELLIFPILSPIIYALFVGASRIRDRRHHPVDVVAGFVVAWLFCTVFFARELAYYYKDSSRNFHRVTDQA